MCGGGRKSAPTGNAVLDMTIGPGLLKAQQDAEAAKKAAAEKQRADNVARGRSSIDNAFSMFNDDFYSQYKKNYGDNYFTPQVENDYMTTRNGLAEALQNTRGAQAYQYSNDLEALDKEYQGKRTAYEPGADAEVAGLKSRVDSAKNELYAQNDTTADFDAIGSAASGKAQQLSKANFSPLGNVFAQFARSPSQTASAGGGFGYSSFGGGAANSAASTSVSPASPASSYVVR